MNSPLALPLEVPEVIVAVPFNGNISSSTVKFTLTLVNTFTGFAPNEFG